MRRKFTSLKGKFLIATPYLQDTNFSERVVFLCQHDENGAFGFIINHRTENKGQSNVSSNCNSIIDYINQCDLYVGGPVNVNSIMILLKMKKSLPQEQRILKDVVLMTDISDPYSSQIITEEKRKNIRIYIGCAGWGEKQLEEEISYGAWKVLEPEVGMIFSSSPELVYKQNLKRLGGTYEILSKMPDKDILCDN